MSDESVMFCLNLKKKDIKYTLKEYQKVYEKLNNIARILSVNSHWTATKCGKAIWTSLKRESLGLSKLKITWTLDSSVSELRDPHSLNVD